MDCSPSGSLVHGILQARILEWVAIPLEVLFSLIGYYKTLSMVPCAVQYVLVGYLFYI